MNGQMWWQWCWWWKCIEAHARPYNLSTLKLLSAKHSSQRISPVQSFISIFKTNPFHMKHQQEKNTTFYPPRPQKRPPHLWELSIVPTGVPLRRVLLGRLRMHRCHPFHPLHASGVAKAAVPAKGPPVKRVSWLEKLWEFLLKAGWMNVDKNNIEIGRFCWGACNTH